MVKLAIVNTEQQVSARAPNITVQRDSLPMSGLSTTTKFSQSTYMLKTFTEGLPRDSETSGTPILEESEQFGSFGEGFSQTCQFFACFEGECFSALTYLSQTSEMAVC